MNLTQEELAAKSGISVRTIQRIESGIEPKGYTLKVLSTTLNLDQNELINKIAIQNPTGNPINFPFIKFINLSALPVSFIPPLNILFPLIVMILKKEFSAPAKQLVSVQILWTVLSLIIFMLSSFLKNWYSLGSKFSLIVMLLLAITNVAIILVNAAAIDRNEKLAVKLNFSFL